MADRWHPVRMRRLTPLVVLVLSTLLLLGGVAYAQDAADGRIGLEVQGSPLVAGTGEHFDLALTLSEPAELRLRAYDFDGRLVRELYEGARDAGTLDEVWFGRDADLKRAPNGPYRIEAEATFADTTEAVEAWVTLADRAVYPKAPEYITIVVDPGHGGDYDGAVAPDGTREADLNLDIGLRLARMLEGAGVNVVTTRTVDGHANEPPLERTGDGVIDGDDELAARPDAANTARADLFLAVHNNIAVNESVGGPSTLYYDERPFGSRNARLAQLVQTEMVTALADAVNGDWQPYDHGTLVYPYYVLRGFDPPRLRRPTQMPGVLSEGLFLSNERELGLLRRRGVRGAMAVAYYDAIAKYLARRGDHVGYELLAGPDGPVPAGEPVRYSVEVRNQGTDVIRDWRLKVNAVKAPARYVSRIRDALPVGEASMPRLEPGRAATLEIEVVPPDTAGEWMLLFDARDRDGRRAAELGSPMLQVRLATAEAEPTPSSPPADEG
jgi:N-acetylmuramoyl-L-alanine amidase